MTSKRSFLFFGEPHALINVNASISVLISIFSTFALNLEGSTVEPHKFWDLRGRWGEEQGCFHVQFRRC
jgi:hypothetical protein